MGACKGVTAGSFAFRLLFSRCRPFLHAQATTGKHLYSLCNGSVLTRPSWLDADKLVLLTSHKKIVILAMPVALALGALAHEYAAIRCLVALAISLYHLVETAFTSRHGEYPVLYSSWAMVLPSPYAEAAIFGVAVHFCLSCGVAKCFVGGVAGWVRGDEPSHPATMTTYLSVYHNSTSSRPLSATLNRWLARHPSIVGVGTLLLECVAVPACLLLPAAMRPLGVWGMIGLHVGILWGMSVKVGFVFLTTLPVYIAGFRCDATVGSAEWWLAASIALLPSALALGRRRLLPEDWPSTPCSLFMWNGAQADLIARLTMTGTTRIVLATREVGELAELVGLPVLHHGGSGGFGMGSAVESPALLHDSVLRVVGFTLIHDQVHAQASRPCLLVTRLLVTRLLVTRLPASAIPRSRPADVLLMSSVRSPFWSS